MKVAIYCELTGTYLEHVRGMLSDLEILATKEIPHDEKIKALLTDPTVKERVIRVRVGSPIFYNVTDYAQDETGREVLLSRKEYTSKEFRPIPSS